MIYQRIISWTLNKIIKTFTIVVFVTLSFMFTGLFVVSAFDMVLLLFLTDFVTLSLATDKVRWSHKPNTWNITGLVKVAIVLGVLLLIEHFGLLYVGLKYIGLQSSVPELNTFVFEMLFFSGAFSIFMVRERGHFWNSVPSRTLLLAIILDMMLVGVISTVGIPGLAPILFYRSCTYTILLYTWHSGLLL